MNPSSLKFKGRLLMMAGNRRFKKILVSASICVGIIVLAIFSSIPLLVRSQYLEELIIKTVKDQTGYLPSFHELRVSFFPTPVLHINAFELKPAGDNAGIPLIRADRARFRPSLFSLLIGKPKLAHVVFNGTDIHYTWRDRNGELIKTISLQDTNLDFWNIRPNQPIRFKVQGKFLSDSENAGFEGTFTADFRNFRIKDLVVKTQLSADAIELSRLVVWWGTPLPVEFDKGTLSISGQLVKNEGSSELGLRGSFDFQNLIYRIPPGLTASASGNYQVEFHAKLDLASGSLVFDEGTITTPFGGPIDVEAKLNIYKLAVEEIFLKSKALHLETLPQYFLSLAEILPVSLGFSGETQLDFFGKGSPELFTVNLRADLTKTTLNYSKYFSKPSGTPLFLGGDLKIAGGRILRGDFSLEFERASMKGSLVGLDLISGDCELTILTNKFNIDGWEQYFPTLRQFELSGGVKVLTNLKGNYRFLDKARFMNNISFDNLEARTTNGAQIRNLNGSIDFGPVDAELRNIQFEIGNTPFSIQGKMLRQPETRWLIGIQSPALDIRDLVSQLKKVSAVTQGEESSQNWDSLETFLNQLVAPGEVFERFDTQVVFNKDQILVPFLRFEAFGGQVSLRATVKHHLTNPETIIGFEIERLNLARMQGSREKPILYGNLFVFGALTNQGPFDPTWLDRLRGEGSVSVTNGELHTIDILRGLGEIVELAPLGRFRSEGTRFNDIRGDFHVENRKVKTENLLLLSEDLEIEGAGDLGFDGNLNFRLSVFLAPALSQKISSGIGENLRLGPIPILITGPITKPEIRKDPMLISTFLQSLVQQQFSRITSRFVPSRVRLNEQSPPQKGSATSGGDQTKASKPSMEQALLESGFNLLESFLSEKKSSS